MIRPARILALLALAACPGLAPAADYQRAYDYQLRPEQSIDSQMLLLAGTAELAGTARDDLFVLAGTNLAFSGHTLADAWLCSGVVTFSGQADDHVRALGQTVTISGQLARDCHVLGSTVHLTTGSVVRGSVAVLGVNVILEGQVDGGLQVLGQSVTLAGRVGGNVRVLAQDIVVMPGTVISGDLTYTSPKELFLDRNVQLAGKLQRQLPAPKAEESVQHRLLRTLTISGLQLLAALLVGIPFIAIFPRLVGRAARHVHFAPGRTMLTGLAACFVLPVAAAFALFTIVGLPLGLVLGGFFAILLYLAKIVVGLAVGTVLLRRRGPQPLSVIVGCLSVGLVALYILAALPVLGSSIALLIGVIGLGALLLSLLRGDGHPAPVVDVPPPGDPGQPG